MLGHVSTNVIVRSGGGATASTCQRRALLERRLRSLEPWAETASQGCTKRRQRIPSQDQSGNASGPIRPHTLCIGIRLRSPSQPHTMGSQRLRTQRVSAICQLGCRMYSRHVTALEGVFGHILRPPPSVWQWAHRASITRSLNRSNKRANEQQTDTIVARAAASSHGHATAWSLSISGSPMGGPPSPSGWAPPATHSTTEMSATSGGHTSERRAALAANANAGRRRASVSPRNPNLRSAKAVARGSEVYWRRSARSAYMRAASSTLTGGWGEVAYPTGSTRCERRGKAIPSVPKPSPSGAARNHPP